MIIIQHGRRKICYNNYIRLLKCDYKEKHCQYILLPQANEHITRKEIHFEEVDISCDCNTNFKLLVYKLQHEKEIKDTDTAKCLVDGNLNYQFISKLLVTSPYQLGYRGYIFTGIIRQIWDNRA